jgi:2-polyprenyl-3-methyl-5-hydroxy-6-metoxy-1,4-benzoquinol methylase
VVRGETIMPWSNPENQQWVIDKVKQLQPKTIIDVGAGAGTYAKLLKPHIPSHYVAIEIFNNYIDEYKLKELYNEVWAEDVRSYNSLTADLIIFGDVLEHMSKEEAISVWNVARKGCKYGIISVPIIHYPQGEWFGNIHETHIVDDWDNIKVWEAFKGITECIVGKETGTYLAKFKEK